MNTNRIKYLIIPFIVVAFMQTLTYWGNQWYAEANNIIGADYSFFFLKFNQIVPFIPWTVYIYVLAFPFWIGAFFYIGYRSKKNMYTILTLILITFTIAGLSYLFFQTDVQAWRETSGLFDQPDLSFTDRFVMWIYGSAGARNANPSMHCIMSWLAVIGARMDKKMPKLPKIIIWTLGVGICISTQTLKQHYIIDLITGVGLVEAFYWLVKGSKLVDKVQGFFTKINKKLKIDWEGSTE